MRIVRAFRLPIIIAVTGLVLSGCMRTGGPVAVVQPQSDLDSMAYGQTYAPAPVAVADSSGGAIAALRSAFAASPRAAYAMAPASAPAVYAAPVEAARYDAAYHLDASDKLRVVVYGQEGLTNTYAIDASGSITMPLIGSCPRADAPPPASPARSPRELRNGFIREPSVAVEIEAYRPFFILGEVAAPGQYPYVPEHDGRERGRDRRRLLAARAPRQRHGHPHRRIRIGALSWCRSAPRSPRRHRLRRRALVLASVIPGRRGAKSPNSGLGPCGPPRNDGDRRHFLKCFAKNSRLRGQAMSAEALS